MKVMRRVLVALLVVALMVPTTVFAASQSPTQSDIKSETTVSLVSPEMTYNASKQSAVVAVIAKDGTELVEGTDYVVNGNTAKAAGTYTATITGIGHYTGTTTIKYTIAKAPQKLTAAVKKTGKKKYTIQASKLQKKSKNFKLKVAKKGKMKVRFTCKNSKIKIDKNGKVTLKKGLQQGTYKIKVSTGSSANYKACKSPKYITVIVK